MPGMHSVSLGSGPESDSDHDSHTDSDFDAELESELEQNGQYERETTPDENGGDFSGGESEVVGEVKEELDEVTDIYSLDKDGNPGYDKKPRMGGAVCACTEIRSGVEICISPTQTHGTD
ncbi:hypothetical protein BJX63DRAFT_431626 [Aspergillus granulosus]|uniref:Uncharacterized protein n=1 Tax=Aspergillus granulosus TaxID=176169 RepID=A0ABR4HGT3_9EURO